MGEAIKEHKAEIIRILREDEEMRCTSIIQSERMLFKLARDFFGVNEKATVLKVKGLGGEQGAKECGPAS